MPRVSNTNESNICLDKARNKYRIEMRQGSRGSRTARVDTLAEAIKIRDQWLIERDEILAKDKAERMALESPGFSITRGDYTVTFD